MIYTFIIYDLILKNGKRKIQIPKIIQNPAHGLLSGITMNFQVGKADYRNFCDQMADGLFLFRLLALAATASRNQKKTDYNDN